MDGISQSLLKWTESLLHFTLLQLEKDSILGIWYLPCCWFLHGPDTVHLKQKLGTFLFMYYIFKYLKAKPL